MKKRILTIMLALALLVGLLVTPVSAATSEGVTVTAVPAYVAMTNDPDAWTLNNLTGGGTVEVDTYYWSNPLGDTTSPTESIVDGECNFTITNTSTIVTDAFVNIGNFSGGDADMTNSGVGTNGATTYGAYSYCTGMTYSTGKVICKTTGSDATKEDLGATTDIKWGVGIETQTDAWTGGSSSTSTCTVSLVTA